MNKIFRVIWNHSTKTWQAVSELAKGQTKSESGQSCDVGALSTSFSLSLIALAVMAYQPVYGAIVSQGTGNTGTAASGADGVNTVVMGFNNTLNNSRDVVIVGSGNKLTSGRHWGLIVGSDHDVAGVNGILLGTNNSINYGYSTSIGHNIENFGHETIVIAGSNATAGSATNVASGAVLIGGSEASIGYGAGKSDTKIEGVKVFDYMTATNGFTRGRFGSHHQFRAPKVEKVAGIAIGASAWSLGNASISLGAISNATSDGSMALGYISTASGNASTAIGMLANTNAPRSVAIGFNASNSVADSVVLGTNSTSSKATKETVVDVAGVTYSLPATGVSATEEGYSISVGSDTIKRQIKNVGAGNVSATSTDAINGAQLYSVVKGLQDSGHLGYFHVNNGTTPGTTSDTNFGLTGHKGGASGLNALSAGVNATATQENATAVGNAVTASGSNATAVGSHVTAEGRLSVAIGTKVTTSSTAEASVAIGEKVNVTGAQSVGIGNSVYATGRGSVAIGSDDVASADEMQSLTISGLSAKKHFESLADVIKTQPTGLSDLREGYKFNNNAFRRNRADGAGSVAIGGLSVAASNASTALGMGSSAFGNGATAVGALSFVQNVEGASAFGSASKVQNNNGTALGFNTSVAQDNGVALGANSEVGTKGAHSNDLTYNQADGTAKTVTDQHTTRDSEVSVGKSDLKRAITNVAAGKVSADSSDAINGSQLYNAITNVGFNVKENGTAKARVNNNNVVDFADGTFTKAAVSGTDNTTVKFNVVTQDVTTTNGVASTSGTAGLATAETVKNAVNNASFNLAVNSETAGEAIKAGDTLKIVQGKNVSVSRTGKDVTVSVIDSPTFNELTVNNRLNANGGLTVGASQTVDFGGNALTNVSTGGTTLTNAANIGDVQRIVRENAEWKIKNNQQESKQVSGSNNVVNFVDGTLTTATVSAATGGGYEVKVDLKTGELEEQNGNLAAKTDGVITAGNLATQLNTIRNSVGGATFGLKTDGDSTVTSKINETLSLKGLNSNIVTAPAADNKGVTIGLNNTLTGLTSASFGTNNPVVVSSSGINLGGNAITNSGSGLVKRTAEDDKNVATVGDVKELAQWRISADGANAFKAGQSGATAVRTTDPNKVSGNQTLNFIGTNGVNVLLQEKPDNAGYDVSFSLQAFDGQPDSREKLTPTQLAQLVKADTLIQVRDNLIDKGLSFKGDVGDAFGRKLGETVNIKGGATGSEATAKNIEVKRSGDDTLEVTLKEDLQNLKTATFGKSAADGLTISNNAIKFANNDAELTATALTFKDNIKIDTADKSIKGLDATRKNGTTDYGVGTNAGRAATEAAVLDVVNTGFNVSADVGASNVAGTTATDRSVKQALNKSLSVVATESEFKVGEDTFVGDNLKTRVTQTAEGVAKIEIGLNKKLNLEDLSMETKDPQTSAVTARTNVTADGVTASGRDGVDGKTTLGKDGLTVSGPNTNPTQEAPKLVEVTKDAEGDGKIAVNGKDGKDGVGLGVNDKGGVISLSGRDATGNATPTTNIQVAQGEKGLNGADGTTATRLTYTNNGQTETVASLNDGLAFEGDDSQTVNRTLNQKLTVKGGKATDLTDNNIGVVKDATAGAAGLVVKLAKALSGLESASFTQAGNTATLNATNLGFSGNNGSITGLENRVATETDYGTGTSAGRAATEGAVKELNERLVNNGFKVNANENNGGVKTHKLGNELEVVALAAQNGDYVGDNLKTFVKQDSASGKTTIEVGLKKNIAIDKLAIESKDSDGNVVDKTNVDAKGITVSGKDGVDGKSTLGKDGLTVTNKEGTNVANVTTDAEGDGKIAVNGKDGKDGVGLGVNDKGGVISLSGRDTTGNATPTTDIQVAQGAKGLNGADGTTATRLTYTNNGQTETVASLNDGLAFEGDDGKTVNRTLNQKLTVKGGKATDLTENNIGVVQDATGAGLVVKLAKALTGLESASFTQAGNTATLNATNLGFSGNSGSITGLENRVATATGYGTGDSVGRAATEGAVKDLNERLVNNGLSVSANQGDKQTHKLGNELEVVALAAQNGDYVGDNLKTFVKQDTATGKTTIEVGLKKNIAVDKLNLKDAQGNETTITANGTTTMGANGTTTVGQDGVAIVGKDGTDRTFVGKDGVGVSGANGVTTVSDGGATFANKDATNPSTTTINGGTITAEGLDGKSGLDGKGLTVAGTGEEGDKGTSTVAKDGLTVVGKDGKDAASVKADENGNGVIAVNGKDGVNGITLTAADGADGKSEIRFGGNNGVVDGLKGIVGTTPVGTTNPITDITRLLTADARAPFNNQAVSGKDLFNVIDNGLRVNANQGGVKTHKLGNELEVVALAAQNGDYVGDNLKTFVKQGTDGKTTIEVGLKKNIEVEKLNLKDDKGNETTVTPTGVATTNAEGTKSDLTADGLEITGKDGSNTFVGKDGIGISGKDGSTTLTDGGATFVNKDATNPGTTTIDGDKIGASNKDGKSGLSGTGLTVASTDPADKGTSTVAKDGLTVKGKDGKDAVSVKADADGNGVIAVNGKDGVNGITLTAADGADGKSEIRFGGNNGVVDGLKGFVGQTVKDANGADVTVGDLTRLTEAQRSSFNNQAVSGKDLFNVIDNGLRVNANQGGVKTHKLGNELEVVALAAQNGDYVGDNLKTFVKQGTDGKTTIEVGLKKNIEVEKLNLKDDKGNETTVTPTGVATTNAEGTKSDLTADGLEITGKDGSNTFVGKDGIGISGKDGSTTLTDGGATFVNKDATNPGTTTIDGDKIGASNKDGKSGLSGTGLTVASTDPADKGTSTVAKDGLTVVGKDGKDAASVKADENGNGVIAVNGKDGVNGITITAADGADGKSEIAFKGDNGVVSGLKGFVGQTVKDANGADVTVGDLTRLTEAQRSSFNNQAVSGKDLFNVIDNGLRVNANQGGVKTHKLGNEFEVVALAAQNGDYVGDNLKTFVKQGTDGKTTIEVGLKKNIEVEKLNLKDDKGNETTVTPTGVATTNAEGTKSDLTADGLEITGKDGSNTFVGKDGIGISGKDGSTTLTDGGATFVNKDATNPGTTTIDGDKIGASNKDGKSGLSGTGLTVASTDPADKGTSTVAKDGLTVKGKDGKDAASVKADENGNGVIAVNGKDGVNGITLTAADGADGKSEIRFGGNNGVVDGLKGIVGTTPAGTTNPITNITRLLTEDARAPFNNQAVSGKDLFNVIDNGLRVNANQGGVQTHKLGNELEVVALVAQNGDYVGDNLKTFVKQGTDGKTTIEVGLKKNIEVEKLNLKDDKGNETTVTPTGVATTNAEGTKSDLTADGLEITGKDGSNTFVGKDGIGISGKDGSTTLTDGGATFVNKDATNPGTTTIDGDKIGASNKDGKSGLSGTGLTVASTDPADKGTSTVAKDGLTVKGKDGKDAASVKADENGNGVIAVNGKDGVNGITLTAADGADGKSEIRFGGNNGVVDGLKGIVGTTPAGTTNPITNITRLLTEDARAPFNNQAVSGKDLFNVIDNGLRVNANQGGVQTHKLGNELEVVALAAQNGDYVGDNLKTFVKQGTDGKTTIEVGLKKNIEVEKLNLKDAAGNETEVTPTGVVVSGKDGVDGKSTLGKDGLTVANKDNSSSTDVQADGVTVTGANGTSTVADGSATFVKGDSIATVDGTKLAVASDNGASAMNDKGLTVTGTGAEGDKGTSTVAKDGLTVKGKDGKDAASVKADENGNGVIAVNGKDGVNGITLTAADGADGKSEIRFGGNNGVVDGLKGIVGTTPVGTTNPITDITRLLTADARAPFNNQAVSGKDLFNVIDNGLRVSANQGDKQTHKLGNELEVVTAKSDIVVDGKTFEGKNLQTRVSQVDGKTTIEVGLNKNIEVEKLNLKDAAGNETEVTPTGVVVSGKDGVDGKSTLGKDGLTVANKDNSASTDVQADGVTVTGANGTSTVADGSATFVKGDSIATVDGTKLAVASDNGASAMNDKGLTVTGTGAEGDKGTSTVAKDGLTVKGKDGKDAVSVKADADGNGVIAVNGKDGVNGITITAADGADGKSEIKFKDNKGVVNGLQGFVGQTVKDANGADVKVEDLTRLTDKQREDFNNQAVSGKDLFNVIDNGLRVSANQGNKQTHKLGNELEVVTLKTAKEGFSGENLQTFISQDAEGKTTIEVGLKQNIKLDVLDMGENGNTTRVNALGIESNAVDEEGNKKSAGLSADGVSVSGNNGTTALTDNGLGVVGSDGSTGVAKDGLTVFGPRGDNGEDAKALATITKDQDGNGQIAVNGKDGTNGVTIGASDKGGVITLTGEKPAADATAPTTDIRVATGTKGERGLDGKDGESTTRITYTNGTNEDGSPKVEQVANLNDGLSFAGDDKQSVTRKLNTELTLKGGADTTKLTENNIAVVKDQTEGANGLNIKLAQDLTDLNSVTVGKEGNQAVLTNNSFAITTSVPATENEPAKSNTFSIVNTANGAKISGVADGDISPTSRDVVTGAQLYQITGDTTTQTVTVDGKDVERVVYVEPARVEGEEPKTYTLTTYNVHGQSEVLTNNVITAVHNMNEQGIKFFHTNDGNVRPRDEAKNTVDSSASGAHATAIGYQAKASASNSLAIGHDAVVAGEESVAIGFGAVANGKQSLSIGTGNVVNGNHSGAIGDPSTIDADNSYSIGNNNKITQAAEGSFVVGNENSVETADTYVLGSRISNTLANSVFLGKESGYVAAGQTTAGNRAYESAIINGQAYLYAGGRADQVAGVVSVGNVAQNGTMQTRRIQNVAPGLISRNSTDAINGSQLYSAISNFNAGMNNLGNRINRIDHDLRSGIASAVAIGSLVQAYNPSDSMLAVGAGTYRGASALSLGYSKVSDNGRVIFKVSGSVNNAGHYMGGASIGYKF